MVEKRAPHREAHLTLLREWQDAGKILMGGAIGDPPHGGVIVFRVEDPAEVERFAAADPYVAAGIVRRRRIEPWLVV